MRSWAVPTSLYPLVEGAVTVDNTSPSRAVSCCRCSCILGCPACDPALSSRATSLHGEDDISSPCIALTHRRTYRPLSSASMALAGRKRKQQDLARDDSVELRGGLQKTVADVGSANGTSNGNGEGSSNVNGTDSDSKDEWTTVTGGGGSALGASGRKKPKKEKVRPAAGASVDVSVPSILQSLHPAEHATCLPIQLAAPLFQFDPAGFRNKSSIQVNVRPGSFSVKFRLWSAQTEHRC